MDPNEEWQENGKKAEKLEKDGGKTEKDGGKIVRTDLNGK